MVEYGAGGQVTQATDDTAIADPILGAVDVPVASGGAEASANVDIEATAGLTGDASAAAIPRPHRRRKRAKGWHCPVCRQRKSCLPAFHPKLRRPMILTLSHDLISVYFYAADIDNLRQGEGRYTSLDHSHSCTFAAAARPRELNVSSGGDSITRR